MDILVVWLFTIFVELTITGPNFVTRTSDFKKSPDNIQLKWGEGVLMSD